MNIDVGRTEGDGAAKRWMSRLAVLRGQGY
jgi:hypothetical protein